MFLDQRTYLYITSFLDSRVRSVILTASPDPLLQNILMNQPIPSLFPSLTVPDMVCDPIGKGPHLKR